LRLARWWRHGLARRAWGWVFVFDLVVASDVGVGGSGASGARGEDELGWAVTGGVNEEHVAAGAVEKRVKDIAKRPWAVAAEDALLGDAACDFESGES